MERCPSRRRFRIRAPHIPIGSARGSPMAGVLGSKLVTLGDQLLPMFIYT
jgi:hypothetical protein